MEQNSASRPLDYPGSRMESKRQRLTLFLVIPNKSNVDAMSLLIEMLMSFPVGVPAGVSCVIF